jgi:hypothetical protein
MQQGEMKFFICSLWVFALSTARGEPRVASKKQENLGLTSELSTPRMLQQLQEYGLSKMCCFTCSWIDLSPASVAGQ